MVFRAGLRDPCRRDVARLSETWKCTCHRRVILGELYNNYSETMETLFKITVMKITQRKFS